MGLFDGGGGGFFSDPIGSIGGTISNIVSNPGQALSSWGKSMINPLGPVVGQGQWAMGGGLGQPPGGNPADGGTGLTGAPPGNDTMTSRMGAIDSANNAGYNALTSEALRNGPSSYYSAANSANALDQKNLKDKAGADAAGQTAKARSDLAAQGGLSSGARERTAETGSKNYMDMSQGITRQGQVNQMNMQLQDQGNKLKALGELPGVEQNKVNAWEAAAQSDRDYNYQIWAKQQEIAAANAQANATLNAGKTGGLFGGGGFLGTGL